MNTIDEFDEASEEMSEEMSGSETKRKGGRPVGLPKTGGRQKGTRNITNQNFYNILTLKISERLPQLFKWVDNIEDDYQRSMILLKIMEFRYPKQRSVEFKLEDDQANSLEEKLYNMYRKRDKNSNSEDPED